MLFSLIGDSAYNAFTLNKKNLIIGDFESGKLDAAAIGIYMENDDNTLLKIGKSTRIIDPTNSANAIILTSSVNTGVEIRSASGVSYLDFAVNSTPLGDPDYNTRLY